jgi:hypothetical protein
MCHSEPFGKLRINSTKNLHDLKYLGVEILRLTPQNDSVRKPREGDFHLHFALSKQGSHLSAVKVNCITSSAQGNGFISTKHYLVNIAAK